MVIRPSWTAWSVERAEREAGMAEPGNSLDVEMQKVSSAYSRHHAFISGTFRTRSCLERKHPAPFLLWKVE